ncbi:hypothetical protein DND01_06690 [Escherichia albertii]|nr:ShET2/EspL2 family type III secretion system effector toxin [Escherichia albertii]EGE0299946.1 hypothetical protein [Escherichia albertii]MCI5278304.1 ShET2/EspL2 family type III secretion system effector toxin [Escherichia albertii]QTA23898.1 ShET2/EspL2 family type III secretion system effector toxin [Escherichia albertii]
MLLLRCQFIVRISTYLKNILDYIEKEQIDTEAYIPKKHHQKKQKNTVSPLKRNGKIKLTKHYSTIEAIQQHVSFHRDTEFRELLQYPPKGSCIILLSKSCSSC